MAKLVPVIEVPAPSQLKAAPWPVVSAAGDGFLRLSGHSSAAEVGTVVWQLVTYNRLAGSQPLRAAIAARRLALPGGLAVEGEDGNVVRPGCCTGLEEWREWWSVPERPSLWLGHDPAPWIEDKGGVLRIWSDGGLSERPKDAFSIDVQRDELGSQLRRVERELQGFLQRLEAWAELQDRQTAADFVARFDQMFEITRGESPSRGA